MTSSTAAKITINKRYLKDLVYIARGITIVECSWPQGLLLNTLLSVSSDEKYTYNLRQGYHQLLVVAPYYVPPKLSTS